MDFFAKNLINWYKTNKRELPWRHTSDPYKIWLSEIILQQTQVVQGLSYYYKFVKNYPTVKHLAKAPIDEVMKNWQGLGYYSRARNLHEAAKYIVMHYKGVFPKTYLEIRQLKGVGDYTAAAIASSAYNLQHAVVDGNVYRVLSRVFGIETPIDSGEGKKQFQNLANELLPKKESSLYNQAIMEFGALYCRPSNPNCSECIFKYKCAAFAEEKVSFFPVKAKKTKVKIRYFNYFIFTNKQTVYISKRQEKDIWQGLYEFYLIETPKKIKNELILKTKEVRKIASLKESVIKSISKEYKHILSHRQLFTRFYHLEIKHSIKLKSTINVKIKDLNKYAFPRLIERYLIDSGFIK